MRACLGKRCSVVSVRLYHSHIPSHVMVLGQCFLRNSRVFTSENMMVDDAS